MLRPATQMQGMMILLLMGLLSIGSMSVYAGDVANSPLERFQEIQKVCARAVEEPLNRTGIPELRECISLLNRFVTSYGSSSLAKNIKNDLPIVPRVDWFDEVIPILDGKYATDGRANNEPIEVVIRPNALRTRISQDLATNLNLELGIKIRIGEGSSGKEYFTTSINELQINSLRFQNVVALIDADLEPDELIIGSNVLHGLQVKDLGESLSISGGVIQEGSEGELGFSLPVITGLLDQLINELVVSFEKRMAKSNRTLQLANGIKDIDEYGIKLGLLEDVRKEVKETANAYPEIYDTQKTKIEKLIANAKQLINETNRKREAFARKLCKQVGRTSLYISNTDDLSQLMAKLEAAYEALARLEDNFEGTNVVSNLKSSPSYCELSSKQISAELDVAHQYQEAMLCIDKGLGTTNYLDRESAFDCALNIFEEIETQSDQSKLASQVENGSPIDGYTKSKLKNLINIEDEAQDKLANAEELREDATDEKRLHRRYEMLTDAMDKLETVQGLGAAVNPEYLEQSVKELRSDLTELARTMPIEPELVHIDGGCFIMGAISGDVDAAEDEVRHEVCVEGFQIALYEVTFDEFDRYSNLENLRLVDDRGWGRGTRPVINVSYMEASAYTERLSFHTGRIYRLPTEAEWEYAARGGQETKFPWGDRAGRNKANCRNCRSEWGGKETAPVGSFYPNGYGIYDMAGNVGERTCSIYRARYDGSERSCQPLDAAGSRVVRGGSWKSHSRNIRTSYRYETREIDKKSRFRGFRLVQENE